MEEIIMGCCGSICNDCVSYPDSCKGCTVIKGNVSWALYLGFDKCPLYKCCYDEKNLNNCGHCNQYPCDMYNELKEPSMNDAKYNLELHKVITKEEKVKNVN